MGIITSRLPPRERVSSQRAGPTFLTACPASRTEQALSRREIRKGFCGRAQASEATGATVEGTLEAAHLPFSVGQERTATLRLG